MKLLNRKQMGICIIFIFLMALTVGAAVWAEMPDGNAVPEKSGQAVEFSYESGLYSGPVTVNLTASGAERILYTLDGSVPTMENEAAVLYDPAEGIFLDCAKQEQVYTIRAAACMEDDVWTLVYSNTYILGTDVWKRYQTSILSIAGDPAAFFDEESGILTEENKYLKGREYEREVQMTLFDDQGMEVLNQSCGIRIYGDNSRRKNQPSFRLYARSEYDEQNDFDYIFFDNHYDYENTLISDFKRIIVRNSGDDNGFSYLRSELALRLSLEAGFPDSQCASPVCVYINGEYYGAYWFVTSYDDRYFREKYGEYDGQMIVLEGVISLMEEQEDEDEAVREVREEYNALHEYAAYTDLNEDVNWEALNAALDVENFLQYVAIENYFGNADSFVNNLKIYRYYSPEGDYREGTVFDGRYRFLLYDLDDTLNRDGDGYVVADVTALTNRDRMSYDIFYNRLFFNIMSRPEGREFYIRYYLSLVNYYFAPQRSIPVMEEMHESHAEELKYLFNNTDILKGSDGVPENADYDHALKEIEKIRRYLDERPAYSLWDLSEAFGLDQVYELWITNKNEAEITVDYAEFHDRLYVGDYFGEVPVSISMTPQCGYRFEHWLVNGEIIEEENLVITGAMIEDGRVLAECVTSPDPEKDLYITAIKSRGGNDYVELTNMGQRTVNLLNYNLSDGPRDWNSSTLPSLEVLPGESVIIYCKNYTGVEALGKPGAGFNLKAGETVNLYRSNGTLMQSVDVPELGSRDGVYTMDRHSGIFREVIPE